jgi:hypothetical protein
MGTASTISHKYCNNQKGQPGTIGQVDCTHELGNPRASILHEQAEMLQKIHGFVSNVYGSERRLGEVMDTMIEDLEDAEVQEMT